MESINYSDLDRVNDGYEFLIKNKTDILNDLNFQTNEDRLLTDSIISNLEKHAAENIRNNNVVQLPYVGVIRKNPLRAVMQNNYNNFRIARKHMNKEEYKEYVADVINEGKEQIREKEKYNNTIKRLISKNKKTYERYYLTIGKAYASLYILALYWLEYVEFDQEVQDMFDYLKDK